MIYLFSLLMSFANAELCKNWGEAERFGSVPASAIESSGLIFSREYKDRLYHINDGKKAGLIVSSYDGKNSREVNIVGVSLEDTEELAYGNCPDNQGACIYVGDIGDNGRDRDFIKIVIIREADFEKSVKPLAAWELRYPDHPHNAEAMAIHPDGSVYVVTKEKSKGKSLPAQIFKASLRDPKKVFTHVGEIDLPALSKKNNSEDSVVTGMTISDNGKKFILMTYLRAWEFNLDLSKTIVTTKNLRLGVDYQPIEIKKLIQQEAITYLPDQKSFLYSTESGANFYLSNLAVNIVRCLE